MNKFENFSKNNRRLQDYDYRSIGLYFITICTKNRAHYFGEMMKGKMILSDEGIIVRDYWYEIPVLHPQVELGEFILMPNHLHGIIEINETVPCIRNSFSNQEELVTNKFGKGIFMAEMAPKSGSISRIIGAFKSACTKTIRSVSTRPFAWQEHFYDRIIRDQKELINIENYIRSNPENWQKDDLFSP